MNHDLQLQGKKKVEASEINGNGFDLYEAQNLQHSKNYNLSRVLVDLLLKKLDQ